MDSYDFNRNKICFKFIDNEKKCKSYHIEFLNSDFKVYDGHVRDLKKIFHKKN